MSNEPENSSKSKPACDPSMSRSQFIRMLIDRATVAGVLAAVPAIAHSFIAPPEVAAASGGQMGTALSFRPPVV